MIAIHLIQNPSTREISVNIPARRVTFQRCYLSRHLAEAQREAVSVSQACFKHGGAIWWNVANDDIPSCITICFSQVVSCWYDLVLYRRRTCFNASYVHVCEKRFTYIYAMLWLKGNALNTCAACCVGAAWWIKSWDLMGGIMGSGGSGQYERICKSYILARDHSRLPSTWLSPGGWGLNKV